MKKQFLLTMAALVFAACSVSAQSSISATGSSGTIAAGAAFTSNIVLTISGTNTVGDVESFNALLGTPDSGPNSAAAYFTISSVTPTGSFDTTNATSDSFPASFSTVGDAANSGSTISTITDVGVNGPAGINSVDPTTGGIFTVENITLQSAANTPAGTYNFYFTSGGFGDSQGKFIDNSNNESFDVDGTPTFTVTISGAAIPEPSTWLLLSTALVGFGFVKLVRRRRVA